MLYIIAIFLFFLGMIFKKSKILSYICIFFMWLLFAFSFENADYYVHLTRYNDFDILSSQTESLYYLIMYTFNKLGLNYREFLIISSTFIITTIFYLVTKYAKYTYWVVVLYMLYPFSMDVNMLRYTLAISLVYIGFVFLYEGNRYCEIKYIAFVLLASMIHISAIIFIIFVLNRLFKTKGFIIFVMLFTSILILLKKYLNIVATLLINIGLENFGNKLKIIYGFVNMTYDNRIILNYKIKMLILLIITFVIYYFIYISLKKNKLLCDLNFKKQLNFINLTLRTNILILPIISLLSISPDLFRIQLSLALINYIAFANYLDIRNVFMYRLKTKKQIINSKLINFIFIILVLCFVLSGLYLWVLSSTNIDSVFKALFENNILLN